MNQTEAFLILGIEITKDERTIKNAYREKLAVTNPEDDPEGFKRLRRAYEEACRYAKETEDTQDEEEVRDTTPSGLWMERAEAVYRNIRTRQDVEAWNELFREDIYLSLEEEENCRLKLLAFLTNHFKLPTEVWKLFDKKLSIVSDAKALREKFPANFVHFIVGRCERGEELEFGQFEGPEDADYDLFLEYYDHCWQALQDRKLEEAQLCLKNADGLGIRHPVMEVSRANLLIRQGHVEDAVALLEGQLAKYPGDAMISYNFAEMLWAMGGGSSFDSGEKNSYWGDMPAGIEDVGRYRSRAAEIYEKLKEENENHYMANVRLTEWYYEQKRYRDAKKCAEKVLAFGGDDAFMELLTVINEEIEKGLEADIREDSEGWESALELCWCYLQDGKIARGIRLALTLEKRLPPERAAEYSGLLSKLYVEQAEYEDSIAMTQNWETALKDRMERRDEADEKEEKKDRDRLRQVHLIRTQCYHNLGFRDRENFALAIRESESVLTGGMKDIGILLEMAQVYLEMEEYGQCLEIVQRLVDEFQVYTAYTISLEAYRRQLNAAGVVRTASQSIHYFPAFVKSYEYLAKVYLDLGRREDFEKVMADAEKNGVGSVVLDAYKYQMDNKVLEVSVLNEKLKIFRNDFLRLVEKGEPGFYEKGLPILTEYLYSYPDDFMLVERAIFHRAAHRHEEAKADFEKALYINPSNPYALNGLSFVHKYCGEYERALFFIKKAILYMDKEMSPVIYADMGNLYALLGDSGRAVAAYRQYRDLAGEVTGKWFFENLAVYTMREGQVREAAAIYENYYQKNKFARYEKLVQLYCAAGMEEEARKTAKRWYGELNLGNVGNVLKAVCQSASTAKTKQEAASYPAYYRGRGWLELMYGDKRAAMKAFVRMFRNGLVESAMEGMIADAVFACILCGDYRRGRQYAEKLRDWLGREKATGGSRYYNRQKGHLQLEFLAAYYTETPEKLQEILNREAESEICHFCTCPLCKELEGMRILLLLRMGERAEAKERLRRNLEIQPWDEYMLAIRHIAFEGIL